MAGDLIAGIDRTKALRLMKKSNFEKEIHDF
jgi:hypothetical protein